GSAEGPAAELDERPLHVIGAVIVVLGFHPEAGAGEGPQGAVFGLGAHVHGGHERGLHSPFTLIDRVVPAGAAEHLRREAAAGLTEYEVLADKAAQFNAGVGPRDVEESLPVHAADLHVFDRLCLDREIGSLRTSDRNQTRGGTQEKAFHHLHRDLQFICRGRVRLRRVHDAPWKVPLRSPLTTRRAIRIWYSSPLMRPTHRTGRPGDPPLRRTITLAQGVPQAMKNKQSHSP